MGLGTLEFHLLVAVAVHVAAVVLVVVRAVAVGIIMDVETTMDVAIVVVGLQLNGTANPNPNPVPNPNPGGRRKRWADGPHTKSLSWDEYNAGKTAKDQERMNAFSAPSPDGGMTRTLTWAEWDAAKQQRTNDAVHQTYTKRTRTFKRYCSQYCHQNCATGQQTIRRKPQSYKSPNLNQLRQSQRPTFYSTVQQTQVRRGRSIDYMPKPKRPLVHVPLYYPPRDGRILHSTRISRDAAALMFPKRTEAPSSLAVSHWPFVAIEGKKGRAKRRTYSPLERFRLQRMNGTPKPKPNVKNVDVKSKNYWYDRYKNNHPAYKKLG
ncbi:hypothetical protein M3Y97_00754300 [Aphelenchoides bicaudatus]|nr:hypothetical protein M3Y97_00754300 [Aphelenchoides bicaudatus]